MSFPSIEDRIIATFKEGLKHAVEDTDGINWDDVDSITEQKLLLMGIRDYDLESEVTIQWYADGDMLPVLDDGIDSPETLSVTDSDDGPYPSIEDVACYFNPNEENNPNLNARGESLIDIIESETFSWLRKYYKEREGPFQDLYLANLDIHLHNYQCAKACDPNKNAEFPDEFVRPVIDSTNRMKQELNRYRIFTGLPPYVTEYSRVAVDVMKSCEESQLRMLEADDRAAYEILFNHLNRFYYQGLWKPITRLIAAYTVDGPEDYLRLAANWGLIDATKREFIRQFESFQERATEYGIDVDIRRDRLPEVWIKEEEFTKDDLRSWNIDNALPREEVQTPLSEDSATDLFN